MNSNVRSTFFSSITVKSHLLEDIKQYLGEELSKEFGGVTCYSGNGFWSENGHENLTRYSSKIENSPILITRLSVLPNLEDKALAVLKTVFEDINQKFQLNNTYLHVEKQKTTAHHITL